MRGREGTPPPWARKRPRARRPAAARSTATLHGMARLDGPTRALLFRALVPPARRVRVHAHRTLALGVMLAVMMFVVILPGARAPKVNCVSLPSAPVGVIDVRAVELAAMIANTNTSGTAMIPIRMPTLKKWCAR